MGARALETEAIRCQPVGAPLRISRELRYERRCGRSFALVTPRLAPETSRPSDFGTIVGFQVRIEEPSCHVAIVRIVIWIAFSRVECGPVDPRTEVKGGVAIERVCLRFWNPTRRQSHYG